MELGARAHRVPRPEAGAEEGEGGSGIVPLRVRGPLVLADVPDDDDPLLGIEGKGDADRMSGLLRCTLSQMLSQRETLAPPGAMVVAVELGDAV